MPNNYLSVLYQHIIQVENKNVGLKVEGHKHTIAPPVKKVCVCVGGGGAHAPLAPPLPTPVHLIVCVSIPFFLTTDSDFLTGPVYLNKRGVRIPMEFSVFQVNSKSPGKVASIGPDGKYVELFPLNWPSSSLPQERSDCALSDCTGNAIFFSIQFNSLFHSDHNI